jgi:Flp pilus assembly protein TadG
MAKQTNSIQSVIWKRLKMRTSRSESGQSLLEVALLTPLLLLLLLGVIEIGRYAYISILVGNAAKAGAAYASQGLAEAAPSNPAIQVAADNDFKSNGQLTSALTVSVTNSCGCDSGGSITSAACNGTLTAGSCPTGQHWVVMASVTCSGSFNSLFNYPGIPSPFTLSRTATMRVAQK